MSDEVIIAIHEGKDGIDFTPYPNITAEFRGGLSRFFLQGIEPGETISIQSGIMETDLHVRRVHAGWIYTHVAIRQTVFNPDSGSYENVGGGGLSSVFIPYDEGLEKDMYQKVMNEVGKNLIDEETADTVNAEKR